MLGTGESNPLKRDFKLETDYILRELEDEGKRPSLLLHCCCGPCAAYVIEYLAGHFAIALLFYNPNIQPQDEYLKRLHGMRELVLKSPWNVFVMECDYDEERFNEAVKGLEREPEGSERCTACFRLRLHDTANRAAKSGFETFCTTLSVSPRKDTARINEIGFELEAQFGVKWLPSDFKKRDGYKRSSQLALEYGLYRQNYCGCRFA